MASKERAAPTLQFGDIVTLNIKDMGLFLYAFELGVGAFEYEEEEGAHRSCCRRTARSAVVHPPLPGVHQNPGIAEGGGSSVAPHAKRRLLHSWSEAAVRSMTCCPCLGCASLPQATGASTTSMSEA